LTSRILVDEFAIDPHKDELQFGLHGVVLYPSTTFCLDFPENVATHHFLGTWLPDDDRPSYKDVLHARYHRDQLFGSPMYKSDAEVLAHEFWAMGVRRNIVAIVGILPLVGAWLYSRIRQLIR
jgi:hypothetical protein